MKKILILLTSIFLLSGCGENQTDKVIKEFKNDVEGSSSYSLQATMEIINNEDTYTYDVKVNFLEKDYYKVYLLNKTNDHEQIILKNEEGVYVVTPSLNKSFKFQSNWPESSSQSYLLRPILKDVLKDDSKITKKEDNYIIRTTVNYPNNEELKYEELTFNKKYNLTNIGIYNEKDQLRVSVKFSKIDYRSKFKKDDFLLEDLIDTKDIEDSETGSLEDIIYPLFIPTDTYLKSNETITTSTGERTILTFAGEKNFILVEEVSKASRDFEIIPVYGEPLLLGDSIGNLTSNSLSWSSNQIDYYLASSDLSTNELLTIANSLNVDTYVGK